PSLTDDEIIQVAVAETENDKNEDTNTNTNTSVGASMPPQDINGQALITELAQEMAEVDVQNQTSNTVPGQNLVQSAAENIQDCLASTKMPASPEMINYTSEAFLKELFSNGNECITAPGGSYVISDTTRSMLALFSNGRYFVAETHKYDGPPLLFVTDTKRRRLQIGEPEHVPLSVITNIYEYAAKMKNKVAPEAASESQEQARMQRNFVTIVSKAAASRVSDIHIVVADHTTVLFRTNGLMQVEFEYNKEWGESFVRAAFASADISDANYAQNEYQAAQKMGKTALRGSGGKLVLPRNVQGIRLQFNPIAFGTRYVVMRLLYDEDDSDTAGDLSMLGFEPEEVETFYRLRAIPTGIVVVAGPTGSGKSTTLQRNMISMLKERNYELNLITVEDPPEYPIPGARQMPVTNAATEELKDREFTKALAASLRSDPDALMIGEVRTLAAADLAFRGALSGHNVWTTLHANSAPAILMRLKDMGVEDFKLQDPSIMKGLLSQRLFRKICPYCRIRARDRLDNPAVGRLHQAFGDIGVELSYLRGPGCKHCEFRGVKGRTVVGEFVLPDGTFLDLMLRGESKKALDYWVTELNGRTLKEAAQERMLKGIIDIEEVERWTG
ncbi:MAG: Flp pilus assembly complex ATPase component TadA, partial [Alphaproteobacteria bacterium]|nr:Flp pilus assembly complex ATPase component TadA [Alphaproteobacteria bacterium]